MTPAELDAILDAHRGEVEGALATTQLELIQPLTMDAIVAAARKFHDTPGGVLMDQFEKLNLWDKFIEALHARGVATDDAPDPLDDRVDLIALDKFSTFASAFRCRVLVDHEPAGSGCLVGPSLVLTAWHVIANQPPTVDPDPKTVVEIRLADGSTFRTRFPPEVDSRCGDAEYTGVAPKADDDVAGRKDFALLRLERPAARHLGYAQLPGAAEGPFLRSLVFLLDFPDGQDKGVGIGKTTKMRGVTVRWRHDVRTSPGSSGGAAFGNNFELLGVHQAKWGDRGRLIPTWVFLDDIRAAVEEDRAPSDVWSLDPGDDRQLILGRDAFFMGVRAAGREVTRVRGVRIKRRNLQAGLGFTYDVLVRLLARRGPAHRPIRITFEELVSDLDSEIRRRLADAGVAVPGRAEAAGVEVGQAAMEAVMRDRSRVLAAAIDNAANAAGQVVWLYFDVPTIGLPDTARLFFEGFVAASLVRRRIRLVIAGFETLPLAGVEFATDGAAAGDGGPGFLVEFVGGFTASDVQSLLVRASTDLLGEADQGSAAAASAAVAGLDAFNGVFADADVGTVVDRVRDVIAGYRARVPVP